ncbi:hypothetical protein [Streptomyces sp. NBC_00647]|uniref:hypothetical protein n=1 Tax=Streptomyces sp. NBC_00647 TaxID=2975796 RepID=UPI0038653CEB
MRLLSDTTTDRLQLASGARVATLGPVGTDAHAEASRLFDDIVLTDSFAEAVAYGERHQSYALVAAGFIERSASDITDSWVDLHFRAYGRMTLAAVWEQNTKAMCIATNPQHAETLDAVRRIAIHPATAVFARTYTPQAEVVYVNAKPIAVECASQGTVDACVGSLDVVTQASNLMVHDVFRPTMVWCLYEPPTHTVPEPTDPIAHPHMNTSAAHIEEISHGH